MRNLRCSIFSITLPLIPSHPFETLRSSGQAGEGNLILSPSALLRINSIEWMGGYHTVSSPLPVLSPSASLRINSVEGMGDPDGHRGRKGRIRIDLFIPLGLRGRR